MTRNEIDTSNIYRINNEVVTNNILYLNEHIENIQNEQNIILNQHDENKIKLENVSVEINKCNNFNTKYSNKIKEILVTDSDQNIS